MILSRNVTLLTASVIFVVAGVVGLLLGIGSGLMWILLRVG